jgi:hypothetical protein
MRPGPSSRMIRGFFGSDAGAERARLAVIDMECFYRSATSAALLVSFGEVVLGVVDVLETVEQKVIHRFAIFQRTPSCLAYDAWTRVRAVLIRQRARFDLSS